MILEKLLNRGLVNMYLKRSVERYLNRDLADDARVVVSKVNVVEQDGYFSASIEANVDITKEAALAIIGF